MIHTTDVLSMKFSDLLDYVSPTIAVDIMHSVEFSCIFCFWAQGPIPGKGFDLAEGPHSVIYRGCPECMGLDPSDANAQAVYQAVQAIKGEHHFREMSLGHRAGCRIPDACVKMLERFQASLVAYGDRAKKEGE